MKVKQELNKMIFGPTMMFESELWIMQNAQRQKMNVPEMIYLKSMGGVDRKD